MAIAPIHIQNPGNTFGGANQWSLNPFYQTGADGKFDPNPDSAYDRYRKAREADSGVSSDGTGSDDKLFSFLDKTADKQFGYQKGLMGLTNEYRTKEGATQGQMDEQAHRRLSTQVSSQQFMQRQGADLTERAKQNDSGRAIRAFKGNF
jgi:hypothetical protein